MLHHVTKLGLISALEKHTGEFFFCILYNNYVTVHAEIQHKLAKLFFVSYG